MLKKDFKNNLINALSEMQISKFDNVNFKIEAVYEQGKRYNSSDDVMRLSVLERANLKEKYFDIDGVVNLLSDPNLKYPLWITIELMETHGNEYVIELKTSLRFRTPSVLQNQETGHPPFKVIKNE